MPKPPHKSLLLSASCTEELQNKISIAEQEGFYLVPSSLHLFCDGFWQSTGCVMAKDYAKKHRKKKDALQLSKEELDFIKDLRASEGYEELKQSWLQRKKAQGGKP